MVPDPRESGSMAKEMEYIGEMLVLNWFSNKLSSNKFPYRQVEPLGESPDEIFKYIFEGMLDPSGNAGHSQFSPVTVL